MKNKDIIKKHAKEFIKNFIVFCIAMLVVFISFKSLIDKDKSNGNKNDSTNETEISIAEQIEDKVKSIEGRYGCINIIYSESLDIELSKKDYGFTHKISNDESKKLSALEDIDIVLERLPQNILYEGLDIYGGKFNEEYGFDSTPYIRINIVLCSEIMEEKDRLVSATATGMSRLDFNDKVYNIFINVDYSGDVAKTFAHELYHFFSERIDIQAIVLGVYIGTEWNTELPEGYKYYGNKANLSSMPYTDKTEEDINNVYFVTEYSQTNIEEDRAEIFSYLLSTDEDEELPRAYESPHVRNRALMIIKEFDECYDTVDENAYWNRIFEENATN